MEFQSTLPAKWWGYRPSLSTTAILGTSLAAGAGLFVTSETPQRLALAAGALVALVAMLRYPELTLAVYVVAGDIKGDGRVAALFPFDLTFFLGAILLAGIALNLLRGIRAVPFPRSYLLFLALVASMTASLAYTPVFSAGVEKLGRFLTVTGIVIVAPFFVLGSAQAMKRFLAAFGVAAFAICAWSLFALGGSARLATPSDNTIGLGHIACALILLIWFAIVPRYEFPRRFLGYALIAVPAVALAGSGSRGPALACAIVILVSLLFQRRLWLDLVFLTALGAAALPFLKIPVLSLEYLATLAGNRSFGELLDFRGDLLAVAWKLIEQHPLLGVGIQGFRYNSPNPALYNWPHNIFVEIACELGIPAGLIALAIFASAIRESCRQLKDRTSPHFVLSAIAGALLLIGIVNATNTGDINSDRTTWLFMSLVFVAGPCRTAPQESPNRVTEVERAALA